ncbi:MAG: DNA-3-methyladenine glycosylase 2 family protein [Patescibacteria group bacterium]|nr:DNA-3-methyladenine glycosylase 2 family protein [Patescibacteria group bacterium]
MIMHSYRQAIKYLAKVDPVMADVIKRAKIKPLRPAKDPFESLVVSIINQQLSGKAADTIENRFRLLFGGRFPKPAQVLKTSDKKLRACGLSFGKISYIKNLAEAVTRGKLDFKKFGHMDDEQIIEQLVKVKGIGRWTAEMFLMFSLGRPNVFSIGDLGLRNGLKKLYRLDAKRHKRKLRRLLDLWHPHKTTASRHLWASLRLD